ncbi:MAG: YbjN domain-containing protein, partial [Oligoflexus sp.]|nr:YbjN domain-containing protein [Oligoflexus sp.]
MNRCTSEMLESFLADYGWAFRREGDGNGNRDGSGMWKTGFRGEEQIFPLSIIMTETWISFIVQPFVELSVDWDSWPEISRLLLELNARATMAKFSISLEGRIELSIEVLNAAFTYDSFSLTMGLLGYYADSYYDEILSDLDVIGYRYSESLNLL